MKLVVVDGQGERSVAVEDLPLVIGGPETDLHLARVSKKHPVAYLGSHEGALFVQPADDAPQQMACNGVTLTTSRWLRDGDLITVGRSRIEVEGGADDVTLRALDDRPAPPDPDAAARNSHGPAQASEIMVAPVDFTPHTLAGARRGRLRLRPVIVMTWALLLVAAVVIWYVVTARSVVVAIEPEPESVSLRGGLISPRFGASWLLRPGLYNVAAEKEGYRDLQASIEVDREPRQTFRLVLEPEPGLLSVLTARISGAEVHVDGAHVGITPLLSVELPPGAHHVTVRAPRHRELRTTVEIEGRGAESVLELELEPAFAAFTVRSEPSGADVLIDGERLGSTPLTTELDAGAHNVLLELAGYMPYHGRIRMAAGEPLSPPPVRLQRAQGNVMVRSEPTGASVLVDGGFRGTTPLDLQLSPGTEHEIKVSAAGHGTWTDRVTVGSGRRSELTATLPPLTGSIVVASQPAGAELLVDGVVRGRTGQTLELSAVPHRIVIRREGFETYETTVTPSPGLSQTLEVPLQPLEVRTFLPPVIQSPQEVEMRLVAPGQLRMGASRREPGRRANESLRDVALTRPFYIAVREVTNREFRQFKEEHLSGSARSFNLEIDHHPVVRVTWENAARYCNWLSARESLPEVYVNRGGTMVARSPLPVGYRLPTEAEWAWAARYDAAGHGRKYAWGDALPIPPNADNFGDESARGLLGGALPDYDDGYPATAPAGSFSANPRGLHNLGGNVAEWVHDVYTIHIAKPGELKRDPLGPPDGEHHVIRGAGWMDNRVTELRLSYRDYGKKPRPDVGFRIARSAE